MGHLHDLVSDVIWQGPPVDEHTAKLVHSSLAQWGGYCTTIKSKSLKKNKNENEKTFSRRFRFQDVYFILAA